MLLASNARVICGDVSVDWKVIYDVVYPLQRLTYKGELNDLRLQIGRSRLRCVLAYKSIPSSPTTLMDLFVGHIDAKCSDRRDKIFSMRDISNLCCREAIPVDYSRPEHILLIDTIIHQLRSHYLMDFLLKSRRAMKYLCLGQSESSLEAIV